MRHNCAVREDDQSFAVREGAPVAICLGEVTFNDAVFALVFDDKREMSGHERRWSLRSRLRAEKYGEGIGLHRFDENGAIGDLVELG